MVSDHSSVELQLVVLPDIYWLPADPWFTTIPTMTRITIRSTMDPRTDLVTFMAEAMAATEGDTVEDGVAVTDVEAREEDVTVAMAEDTEVAVGIMEDVVK